MDKILVLDFGGQYAHLIARRFRNLGFYSEISLPDINRDKIKNVKGIVLSGGPSSVYDKNIPKFNKTCITSNIPNTSRIPLSISKPKPTREQPER